MIVLFRDLPGPANAMIRRLTGSDYSHAAWLCDDGSVWHATFPQGVCHVRNIDEAVSGRGVADIFKPMDLSPEQASGVVDFCRAHDGEDYDTEGVIGFFARRETQDPAKWFCSELMDAALKSQGCFVTSGRIPSWRVSPEDLYKSAKLLFSKRVQLPGRIV